MGHAYVAGEGCDEAMILGACSSQEEDQMEALLSVHGEAAEPAAPQVANRLPRQPSRRRRA